MAYFTNCTHCKCKLALSREELPDCPHPELVGDGICHDFLNRGKCFYDGGDCCIREENNWILVGPEDGNRHYWNRSVIARINCTECKCRIHNPACPKRLRLKIANGVCNDEANIPQCSFDGDDCCQRPATANRCIPTCHASPYRRDKHCHNHLNNERCGYDGLDCACMWRGVEGGRCAKFKLGDRALYKYSVHLIDRESKYYDKDRNLYKIYHDVQPNIYYPDDYNDAFNECYMYKGKCVWFERDPRQFQSAARHCAQMGGRLWEPQSVHEYQVINK